MGWWEVGRGGREGDGEGEKGRGEVLRLTGNNWEQDTVQMGVCCFTLMCIFKMRIKHTNSSYAYTVHVPTFVYI